VEEGDGEIEAVELGDGETEGVAVALGTAQVAELAFQLKPAVELQPHVLWRGRSSET
jgi:hypothetical protein